MSEGFYQHKGRRFSKSAFETRWFKDFNIEPKVILDIGAYDLGDSIRFALEFPGANVYSFEGCPGRNAIIAEYKDEYENIIHIPYAVSDKVGKTNWYSAACRNDVTPEEYGAQGSIFKHSNVYKASFDFIEQREPIEVECLTISYVCGHANVALAHIDVEGAELNVIRGFGAARPKLVFVETILDSKGWEGGTNAREMHDTLLEMGYRRLKDLGNDQLYLFEETP